MQLGLFFRLSVLWGLVVVGTSVSKAGSRAGAARRSRQVYEADALEGVWSPWEEWSECSQICGVGLSKRTRMCLPPPPPHAPAVSRSPPNWGGYVPGEVGGPVISAMRPYYPARYPGQHPSYYSPPLLPNHNPGLPLYRNAPTGGGAGPVPAPANPVPPFYPQELPSANQDPVSMYQPPYHATSHGYSHPAQVPRRPANPGATRPGVGGNRRSVSTNREGLPARRWVTPEKSSAILPGKYGYGRSPFSLPLHRPNRQARHAANGTGAAVAADDGSEELPDGAPEDEEQGRAAGGREGETGRGEGERGTQVQGRGTPAPGSADPHTDPHRHVGRGRERGRFSSSSSPILPPPHAPRLPNSHAPPPYSSPLHRSSYMHREQELHPGFGDQAPPPPPGPHNPSVYPLQLGREGEPRPSQSHRCSGEEAEYRRCFSQVCAGRVLDSRAEQCAAFNTQVFMGRLYDWEPFTEVGADKQCELTCRPAGYRFYVRQAERVRDGTPCFNISSNDVCVDGRCLTEGCDGVLGSGSVIDRCGVCGGRESSCRKVTGSFQNTSVPLGYHKILDIPAGATFINITERQASPNYLALRTGTAVSVVNGRWAVDPPGEYKAGGTTFTYARPRAQAEGQEERGESLSAPGPTATQLQLYIIFHQQNPGIDYEFYVPVEKQEGERTREREVPRERQREGPRGRAPLRGTIPFSVSVEDPIPPSPPISLPSFPSSSSSSSSPPSSSDRWTPERSRPRGAGPNRNARIPPRTDLPPDTQLPFVWRRGGLTECSASCGKGTQYRMILCINRHTDQEVHERKCDSAAKPVPEEEPCNTHSCPPFWEASAWSECSVSCGQGVQQRQLQCRQSFGNRSTMVHPQRCASLTPPDATQSCQLRLCSHWEVGSDWSSCSVDCGVGRRTRSVRCLSDHGNEVSEQECNSRLRPQGSEECHMGPCVTNWYFTDWSNMCSAQCGPGVQRREVVCLTRGGGRGGGGGGGGDCVGEKPAEMKACNRGACVPTTMWYSSPWAQCNVACGNGTQRRDIICIQKMGNDITVVPTSECSHLDKPPAVQECEMDACKPQWFTTEWSACSRSCGKGVQMREVRCLTPDKQHKQECDPTTKPEQEQVCNTIPCSPQVADENCRDQRHNCVMVVQARLCVYSYYKTSCCASCTQSAQRAKRH